MTDISPAAVMAAHPNAGDHFCANRKDHGYDAEWPCEPYRLAEALATQTLRAERAEVRLASEQETGDHLASRVLVLATERDEAREALAAEQETLRP